MKVVVTGATGNVGRAVVRALEADPHVERITGIARRLPTQHAGRTTYVADDIVTADLAPLFAGADVVIHLAWHFQPTHAPDVTWLNNCVGSQRVFDAVAAAGVPAVIHASSVGTYSPVSTGDDEPRDETWPTHSRPGSCYGREKAYVERVLDVFEARHRDVRTVRMRPAFIFSRESASEQRRIFAGPFVPNFLLGRGRLPVLPFPKGLRFQALHVDDVAAAYVAAAKHHDASGAFNLAAGPVVGGEELARLLRTRLVLLEPTVARTALAIAWHLRLAPAEPALLSLALNLPLLDATRAREQLDWEPRHSSLDALRELIRGIRKGEGAPTAPLTPDSLKGRLREVKALVGGRDA